jgi:hypothetical protein
MRPEAADALGGRIIAPLFDPANFAQKGRAGASQAQS